MLFSIGTNSNPAINLQDIDINAILANDSESDFKSNTKVDT